MGHDQSEWVHMSPLQIISPRVRGSPEDDWVEKWIACSDRITEQCICFPISDQPAWTHQGHRPPILPLSLPLLLLHVHTHTGV